MCKRVLVAACVAVCLASAAALPASADTEVERKIQILTEEIQKIRNELAVTEEPGYSSAYGLGPAASKVYRVSKGLSIGGYGEGFYTAVVSDRGDDHDRADLLRFVLYAGYKFTDRIVFNSEVEFEHASTGESGEVAVEFAALDFLLRDEINLRVGQLLIPVGITNEQHEPTLFHGVQRPQVERTVIPTTWREMGVGLFGRLTPGLDYKLYLVNGLDATGFSDQGLRGGRQDGSKAKADDWAVVARLDYEPALGFTVGGSAYLGDSGQGQAFAGEKPDVFTQLYEVHGQVRYRGLELKALAAWSSVGDSKTLSESAGQPVVESATGWYAEVAYDVMPHLVPVTGAYLAPFVRYERVSLEQARGAGVGVGPSQDFAVCAAGVSFKPIPNVVVKVDYRNFVTDEVRRGDEASVGFGFIF